MASSTASGSERADDLESDRICRICLNNNYESDSSKLDKRIVTNIPEDLEPLTKLVRPCKCSGSIGFIHKGCLLLEAQYRKSSICHLCKSKFKFVNVRIFPVNTFPNYVKQNKLRTMLSVMYLMAIPILTLLWFANKIRFSAQIDHYWNNIYRKGYMGLKNKATSTHLPKGNSSTVIITNQMMNLNRIHPLLFLVFAYHWDVLWINLINLLLVQLLIANITHYQDWVFMNRSRTTIELTN